MIKNEKQSYIYEEKIQKREYQYSIATKCVNKNSLVVLPTGLGKTIIGVYVAGMTLEQFPKGSKVIVMAPTRPLINQHYESFQEFISISEDKFCVLTGKTPPEKRSKLFKENQLLFYTPQTLRNDLVNDRYTLESVCLVIFDEAHHASGDYPYPLIAEKYVNQNPDGTILALTASPGSSKEEISKLCKSLQIPPKNTHFRTRQDDDVKKYLKPMDVFKIGVDLTELMENVYEALLIILEERLQYLSQFNFLEIQAEVLHKKVMRKDLVKLNQSLLRIINGEGDKTGAYSAISINAQALIVYHMLELVEQQGLDVLLTYLEKLYKDSKKNSSSKAVKVLASEYRLQNIFLKLKESQDYNPQDLVHPKFHVLKKLLINELSVNSNCRILVFVKLRDSVRLLTSKLKKVDLIKVERFVGQATKSKEDKGLSQKKQLEILKRFKDGELNVLISTNVGEEGLDIAECNLVVFYDVVASEIRLIQRKGRTGRFKEGRVAILYAKNTRDEILLRLAMSRIEKMNKNLKNHKGSQRYSNNSDRKLPVRERKQLLMENFLGTSKPKYKSKQESKGPEASKNVSKSRTYDAKLSKKLPSKLGLRKKLTENNLAIKMVESKYHIVLYDKLLIQIYNPKELEENDFIRTVLSLKEKFSLVISIIDYIDFEEDIINEKRLSKKKMQDIGDKNNFQVITIDNAEELYFIINNIKREDN